VTAAAYRVAGDWGTSKLRLFRWDGDRVVDRIEGPGIGVLEGVAPAQALRDALAPWRRDGEPRRIVLCGMAGARIGLAEAPYADCPAGVADWSARARRLELDGIPVAIAAGLACLRDDERPDVMRGEETQLFGALRLAPALGRGTHLLALPGTHGKWVGLQDGRVQSFHTFPSGELYALLRERSTLTRVGDDDGDEAGGFDEGGARARSGAGLLGDLFHARAAQLRAGRTRGWARGYLSGLVLGHEVREAMRDRATGTPVTLVGDPALCARYARLLADAGHIPALLDGDACASAGLHLLEDALPWT
jgi:2-dehydro-3-deoxygalactonokinase